MRPVKENEMVKKKTEEKALVKKIRLSSEGREEMRRMKGRKGGRGRRR